MAKLVALCLLSCLAHALVMTLPWGASLEPKRSERSLSLKKITVSLKSTKAISRKLEKKTISGLHKNLSHKQSPQKNPSESYLSYLMKIIEMNKSYPKKARILRLSGVVLARIKVHKDGSVTDIALLSPSPHHSLNRNALKMLRELPKLQPLPKRLGKSLEVKVPLIYNLD